MDQVLVATNNNVGDTNRIFGDFPEQSGYGTFEAHKMNR
jgi:hypothetical protein